MSALRNVGAVVAGWFAGSVANMALIMVNMQIYPAPDGVDFTDQEAFAVFVASLPAAAFVVPAIAHIAQAFVGGWVAARIGTKPMMMAMIVGVVSLIGGIMNYSMINPPSWTLVEMPLYLVAAWGAGTLEVKRRAAA